MCFQHLRTNERSEPIWHNTKSTQLRRLMPIRSHSHEMSNKTLVCILSIAIFVTIFLSTHSVLCSNDFLSMMVILDSQIERIMDCKWERGNSNFYEPSRYGCIFWNRIHFVWWWHLSLNQSTHPINSGSMSLRIPTNSIIFIFHTVKCDRCIEARSPCVRLSVHV